MLRTFRQQKIIKFFLWLVIVAFIGTIFLVWGVGNNKKQTDYAIKINDIQVSFGEYKNAYEKTSKTFRQLLGGQPIPDSIDIGKQVRENLIDKYLLLQKAMEMKISVSDVEVLSEIMKIPSFYVNGSFDKQRYLEILRLNRINPEAFEADIKQQLLLSKISNIVRSSVDVTDKEIENEYIYRNTSASISFIELKPADFEQFIKVDEKELEKYFNEHKENYRVPEKIKAKYIVFDPKNYTDNISISKSEIEAYYIKNKEKFDIPETVEAQHIITRVKDWNDNASVARAKAKIEEALKQLKKGKDFSEVAKKYSEGPTAKNGGNLGKFKKGDMVKEFEDVAFKLKDGEISGVVKSDYGFHIIKVIKHNKAKQLTLDEAEKDIVKVLKNEKIKTSFRNYVLSTYKKILDASNISAYIDAGNKLKVYETKYFSLEDNVEPFLNNTKAKSALFRLQPTEVSNIISLNGKQYIFEIEDKKASFIPKLKSIKEDVVKDYKIFKASEMAYVKAQELCKLKDIKKIANSIKKTYVTTPEFKRVEPIPQIGPNSDLSDKIFSTKPNSLLKEPFKLGNVTYIILVNEIKKPDLKDINAQKKQIKSYILNAKQQEAYNSFVEKLRKSAKIEINPAIIEK